MPSELLPVLADGLSARAIEAHAVPLIEHILPRLRDAGWSGTNCDVPVTCTGATAPANGATGQSTTATLSWGTSAGIGPARRPEARSPPPRIKIGFIG